ncbi:LOW QUALITY PROTEIN: tubulin epsilon and delta complex protein 1 [Anarrhichthys ocellatus]|uniref:LOW QUALITY PROTEIN: tubulin epsilon and delta complex protein 1 n=1 Tax=Anarrhichthys ocellatus TaxID=433405 RepID=UPI0012ED8F46|nr:LOW QUALITY PROTEIN: tubulin epsilon and delta complex protein 1 [Anarrhichthys ocellatus]
MQRSKAAVSVEVKQVIGALCRLLAAAGLESVPPPENFRRAKFGGGPEVEDQFWQLLVGMLQTSSIVSQPGGAAENRKLVAAGLWQTGYHADWMYGLGGGGGGGGGGRLSSRDLLLALGWLLATGKLDELLTWRVQRLDKTLLTPTPMNPQLPNELPLDSASLRKLQWLIGCLRHQGRTLLSMQEERTRLLHAVFFASIPSSVSSSSDQSSTVLREDCVCVQWLCDLLEAYLNWKQVEKVFWTWMDSVLDCHLTDPVVEETTHDAPNGSARVCHHGNRGLGKLEDVLLRLPTGQKEQRRGRGDVEDRGEGGERWQGGSDTSCLSPLPSSLPQVYRASFQTGRPVRHSSHQAEGTRDRAETPDELPASQAAQLLLQTEALLLERRDRQRLANRMQLQDMIGRLDELVLIPPQTFI